ncbi:GNAT family N-acetyltransferase [Actinoallomurus sp. NBC_01490]|uniref:GNAT family N-acetyltransferase n=1 Tax=Actinoallomurus sp. NBC_01490 TaxID=2903557 RepID=UPI002E3161A6|nr:GNAT family N-acetyltransferase [Actinoallomurus sp. NBC_01490]
MSPASSSAPARWILEDKPVRACFAHDGTGEVHIEEERPLASIAIELHDVDGDEAARRIDEYHDLYAEIYAGEPYSWGPEYAELFQRRFDTHRQQAGFALVEARTTGTLIGLGYGISLSPAIPWWQNLITPIPPEVTDEPPGRTWALTELMIGERWRRLHLAEAVHDRLLGGRTEERATTTVLPAATAAQAAVLKWGWEKVGRKRNPLPGAPVFDVLVKTLER